MDSNSLSHRTTCLPPSHYLGVGNYTVPGPVLDGLSRYQSAPTSFFADVDFLCRPSTPETQGILEGFISGTAESDVQPGNGGAELPMTMKREETGEGFLQQRNYASPVSKDMGMEYMVIGGGTESTRVAPAKGGYDDVPSSLVRHSSSPAGLLDNTNNINERHVSRFNGTTMSPIHEIEKKNMVVEVTTSTSSYLAGIALGSFDNGRMSLGGNHVLLGQIDDKEEVHRTRPLARHLSLRRESSADITAIESFLQLKDSVPCKVRAKRGCATHPRSIAERVRRTKISERIRKLQDLVPHMVDKQTNTAEMLDLAVDYIKELQGQVKTLLEERARCTCLNNKYIL